MDNTNKLKSDLNPQELQDKIESIVEEIEEDTHEALIRKLAEQELHIEKLYKLLASVYSLQELKKVVIDNKMLSSPSFLRKSMEITPVNRLLEYQGFFLPEGKEKRWTMQEFYFDLPIDRTEERQVTLKFACKYDFQELIECYVDGHRIETILADEDRSFILSGKIPLEDVYTETRISFKVGKYFIPSEKDPGSHDNRMLSISFQKLTVA